MENMNSRCLGYQEVSVSWATKLMSTQPLLCELVISKNNK